MHDFDRFAATLLDASKAFLSKAVSGAITDVTVRDSYLHASLCLGFCSLEAHVNAIADDFTDRSELSALELSILREREVKLVEGRFEVQSTFKAFRLSDRIEFVCRRFSGTPIDKGVEWWGKLGEAQKLRNALSHPKETLAVTTDAVRRSIEAIIAAISHLYRSIYGREYPTLRLGLTPTMEL